MKRILRKSLVIFLLGWLPLQAGALPAMVLDCELDPEGSAMHRAMHGGGQHDRGHEAPAHDHEALVHGHEAPAHDHEALVHDHEALADGHGAPAHDHDGDTGHDALGHGCCHNLSSGAAAAAPIVSLPAAAIVPVALTVHPYRFFPELLKRPPLADLV